MLTIPRTINPAPSPLALRQRDFTGIRDLLYRVCGIDLGEGKRGLVQTRLFARLRELQLQDYGEYLDYVLSDPSGHELSVMVDRLSTNKTDFFRESQHFDFLCSQVLPAVLDRGAPLRIWSAACSSGEEPYTIAMALHEAVPDLERRDTRILATDVSSRVLQHARRGVYSAGAVERVPPQLRQRYFRRLEDPTDSYQVHPSIRRYITFARLNLIEPWPMHGPFEVVFCRNVMIYFDLPTQEKLVNRLWELLEDGGYLFIGHSESLNRLTHRFRYIGPSIYRK